MALEGKACAERMHDGVEVQVRDIANVGAVIDAALALRVTDMSPVRLTVSSQRTLIVHDSLLTEATRRARQDASVLASANGSRLGAARC